MAAPRHRGDCLQGHAQATRARAVETDLGAQVQTVSRTGTVGHSLRWGWFYLLCTMQSVPWIVSLLLEPRAYINGKPHSQKSCNKKGSCGHAFLETNRNHIAKAYMEEVYLHIWCLTIWTNQRALGGPACWHVLPFSLWYSVDSLMEMIISKPCTWHTHILKSFIFYLHGFSSHFLFFFLVICLFGVGGVEGIVYFFIPAPDCPPGFRRWRWSLSS